MTIVQPCSRGFWARSRTGQSITPSQAGRSTFSGIIQQALHAILGAAERRPRTLDGGALDEALHRLESASHQRGRVQRPEREPIVEEDRPALFLRGVVEQELDQLLAAVEPADDRPVPTRLD